MAKTFKNLTKVHLLIYIVSELIITAKSNQSTQSKTVREEYLCDSIDPYFRF